MERELLRNAEKYHKKRHKKKIWQRVISVLGCAVVFCVTYALVLPAITEEKEVYCGMEEHVHEDSCYSRLVTEEADRRLVCTLEEKVPHVHEEVCYELQGHAHTDSCYLRERGELLCQIPEMEGHTHAESCYVLGDLTCTAQENHIHAEGCYAPGGLTCAALEGHVHAESCYADGVLICTEPENHAHGAECYGADVLTCAELENHVHDSTCYQQTLICEVAEAEGHTHSDDCYQMTETLICTLEESPEQQVLVCTLEEYIPESEEELHVHGDACYAEAEKELTCQLPEDENHTHGDRCYGTWELTCGLEEHTHDLRCAANPNADLESAAIWEQTFAEAELTGVWAQDVLAIAETQIGYRESQKNYVVLDDSNETKGYTRYGAWYGIPYGDWCAMFVSFCLDYAGVEDYPLDCNCPSWINALTELEMYQTPDVYTPVPGDVIFFDWNENMVSDHVGLVKAVDLEKGELITIEGNNGNTVAEHTYKLDDTDLLGYGILPENPEQEPVALAQQVLDAVIYTDGTYAEIAQDDTAITVSGLLPVGAEVKAYPVALQTDIINGRQVILAYDISVFDKNGRLFEQADASVNVSIRPADWEEKTEEDEAEYNVYYIPEAGDPQPMDTTADEAAVNFQTDHFSTYALTASGTLNAVYLNGATGDDTRTGTATDAAVKTLEKAMALVKTDGTIYICGTVTVSDEQEWDVGSKVTIERGPDFTGPLIIVDNGGSLVLSNITINGGSGTPSSSNIATDSTFAGSAKAPLIVVNNGGRLDVNTGTILEYNSNVPNSSNNKFVESGYIGLGGAIYCNGTLTMNGGLIQYCEAQCGGGVYVENGNFYLNGGTIDHNYARDIVGYRYRVENYHKNAGGGVYVGDNSTMTMTGGTVSYNQSSREGGGISLGWLNRSNNAGIKTYITTFTMNGGTLDHNYATSTGGGLNIAAGRQAFINAGYITYNTADGKEYQDSSSWVSAGKYTEVFSGGGIYIDAAQWSNYASDRHDGVPGKAVINRALITQNTATNSGGGIAACGTSNNYVYGSETNGTAIYNNSSNEVYVYGGSTQMGDTVLGGGKYNWTQRNYVYDNTLTDNSSAIVKAKELATVFITNNTGYLGGGIGCNGLIEIGGEKEESTYINIKKVWDDGGMVEHPDFIEVQILQDGSPYGEPIRIYRTYDENGNEIWPTFYVGGLPGGHEYSVKELEVPGYMATIEQVGKDFIITNRPTGITVTKQWVDESGNAVTSDLPDSITVTVQLYQNGEPYGDPVELNAAGNWSHLWLDLPEKDDAGNLYVYTAKELSVPEGFYSTNSGLAEGTDGKNLTITNIKSPETSVSVKKEWAEGATVAESVTIQLLRNGEAYGIPVELSEANNWFDKWEGLPAKDTSGNPYNYTVKEIAPGGYDVTIAAVADGDRPSAPSTWKEVTSLENGKTYLLVSSEGALAADASGLSWQDVGQNLADGTNPNSAALWTYNGSTLKSGSDKFLKLNSSGSFLSKTYTYAGADTGSTVSFSDGYISVKPNSYTATKYFGTIDTNNGTASALDEKASATTFTAYTLTEGADPCADWGVIHYVVTNAKPLVTELEVKFAKYSTGTDTEGKPTLLAGAELELYKEDPNGDVTIPGTEVLGTLIEPWTSEAGSTDNQEGVHVAENLSDGTYYLVETKAPDGHLGLDGPIIFQVSAEDQKATVTSYPGRQELEGEVGEVLPVYNDVAVVLPETGGPGTYLYTTAGLLLMLTSAAYLVYNSRKRRREAR